jgi:hypothetical protein
MYMRGKVLFATALVAIASLMGVFAQSAYAHEGLSFPTPCTVCHTGVGVNPVATLVSNDGTTATYDVTNGGEEWAVFQGSDRVPEVGQPGSEGQFSVPVGSTYTLYAVNGYPGTTGVTIVNPGGDPITTHTISVTAGANGSVSPGSESVPDGSDADFSISANTGFHIVDVQVDSVSVGAVSAYTFHAVTADHTITATFAANAPSTFAITPSAGLHGSISPATVQNIAAGASATFTFTASSGYHVGDVKVDGVTVTPTTPTTYKFTNVGAAHTVAVTFAADAPVLYPITVSAGSHGTISPAGTQNIVAGSNASFTFTAAAGYHVDAVLVDGVPVATATSYTFTNVREAHDIAVGFALDTNPITPSAGAGGSISPAVVQNVAIGASSAFTFTADPGFHVADVLVDGNSVGAVGSYTFTDVRAGHAISVSFAADEVGTFHITPGAGTGGAISPAQVQAVAAGQDVTFTITPDPGSHIAVVTVDGVAVANVTTYAFTGVQADHTIAVTFAADPVATTSSLSSNHSSVKHGKTVKLSSVLRHLGLGGPAGVKVRYEYKKPGSSKWVLLTTRTTGSTGATSYTTKLKSRGTYSYRVRFLATALWTASTSRTVKVKSK